MIPNLNASFRAQHKYRPTMMAVRMNDQITEINPFPPMDVIGHRKQFSSSSSTWLSRKWPVIDGLKPFGCGQMQNIQTLLWKVLNTHQTPLGLPKGHLMNTFYSKNT